MTHPRTVLTGIKPTGSPHLGNLLGAIRPALAFVRDDSLQALYFIADYHALTLVQNREQLRQLTYEVAATWLAFGLPDRAVFYRQSSIPEIFELAWILSCFTSKGWMNKAHAYKAKVAENLAAGNVDVDAGVNMGLYDYPILMAADILLFASDLVPVGKDQEQHVEIARDIALRFNHVYNDEVFILPSAIVDEDAAVIPGLDGRKMSKSYNNTIPLFLPSAKLKNTIGRIITDSTLPEAPKDPETSTIFQIYEALASPEQTKQLTARYHRGISWGDAKAELFALLDKLLREPRRRYEELMGDRTQIDGLLAAGARRARAIAKPLMDRVRKCIGIG